MWSVRMHSREWLDSLHFFSFVTTAISKVEFDEAVKDEEGKKIEFFE